MMPGSITESDWKVFRRLHAVALDRYCERLLGEAGGIISDRSKSHHDRYTELYDTIRRRDKEMAAAFDDFRRSTALLQISIIHSLNLWSEEELGHFSDDAREYIGLIAHLGE